MNSSNLQRMSSNAVGARIKSTEEVIRKKQSDLCQQQKKCHEEVQWEPFKDSQLSSWTSTYEKWDKWEDIEEIEEQLKNERQKLTDLRAKSDTQRPSIVPCCRGSQDRRAERKVARMTTKNRLQHMKSFRSKGNIHFKKGKHSSALQWYTKSLIYYEYCFPIDAEEKKVINRERRCCLLNCAACYLQQKQYNKCIEHCTEALDLSAGLSAKALFRRSQAYRYLDDFDAAETDLKKAKRLDRSLNNVHAKVIDEEALALTADISAYKSRSEVIAKRMLNWEERVS